MTLDLNALRAMRKSSSNTLAKIANNLEKQEKGSFDKKTDERMWSASLDKTGSGSAVIRFLPAVNESDLPWVKLYTHGFKGPSGKWYIENCLTTLGEKDPVVDHCNTLWNSGIESDKKLVGERKRRLSYYANVLIVKDPANPENEGTVRIFRFGKKLFDKIKDKLSPTFADEQALDVFNPWEGANFRLRIAKVEGYSNTDKSVFDSPSAIADDDEEILRVLNARHNLQEFVDPKNFKSYEELAKKLDAVLNESSAGSRKAADFILDDEAPKVAAPKQQTRVVEEPTPQRVPATTTSAAASTDDEDLSFFSDLLND